MAWPSLPPSNTPLDWGEAALLAVRRYCGWHIAPVIEEDLVLDGPGGRVLLLPSGRVEEILSLTEDGQTVDPATLQVSEAGIVRKADSVAWSEKYGSVKLRLRHGYEDYDDLRAIVSQVAARAAATGAGYVSEAAGPFNVRRGTVAGGEVAGVPLLGTEKLALAPYRLSWGV